MKRIDYYWNSINFISVILLPLSGLFCLLASLRKYLYRSGVYQSYKAPLPVMVIGNISVGGTGKTPLIIELVKQLQQLGKKPAVISRGYGGKADSWPQVVNETSVAEMVGDEPQLIFQQTGCPLVVGPNRQQDIELLLQQFECDVVLSDDGLQHYALQRDIEIAVVDAQRQFGNGFCIPSGPLREGVSRLQQVDLVLFNGGNNDQLAFSMLPEQCRAVGMPSLAVKNISDFSGQTVHAIAGIGHPQRFFDMLTEQGLKVIPHALADHYAFSTADFDFDIKAPVLMTEKDAIKCTEFKLQDCWSVPVKINLTESAQLGLNKIYNAL